MPDLGQQVVLSIGIPAFKDHAGVIRILNSLADRADVEILVSEDVPTHDDGIKSLPDWANIRYIKNSPPLGAVQNWNAVLQKATGDFLWVIHHDEAPAFPNGFDAFVRHLKETDAEILLSRLNKNSDNAIKRAFRSDSIRRVLLQSPTSILFQNYIGSPSNVIVRESQVELFDERLKWFVDMEWFYRLLKKANSIDLSNFEVTPFPHEQSIKATLKDRVTAISLIEIDYICSKHHIGSLFHRVLQLKSRLRGYYTKRRRNA